MTCERLSSYTASSSSDELEEGTSRREMAEPISEGGAEGTVMDEVENRRSMMEPDADWGTDCGIMIDDAARDSSDDGSFISATVIL